MTEWTAQIMPDDALDGLVGSMLANVKPTSNDRQVRNSEPVPLWKALDNAPGCLPVGHTWANIVGAAEIEAFARWLLPDEPEPREAWGPWQRGSYDERQRLRAILTEQANIAREAS